MRLIGGVSGILFGEALAAEARWCSQRRANSALEGIVSKRAGSLCKSGKSHNRLEDSESGFRQDVTAVARDTLPTFESRTS
jgi:hypothetical protein